MAGPKICGDTDAVKSRLSLIAAHSRNRCIGIGGGKHQIMPLHAYSSLRRYKRAGRWFFRRDKQRNARKQLNFPLHLPKDMQRFKRLTMDKPIIMGRNTYLSIGSALPGRYNIVLSQHLAQAYPETILCANLADACDLADRINCQTTIDALEEDSRQLADAEPNAATYLKYKGKLGKASGKVDPTLRQNEEWKYMPRGSPAPAPEDQSQIEPKEIMVIGGASVYHQVLSKARRVYVTIVDAQINGDVFFPDYHLLDWHIRRKEQGVDGGWSYSFLVLDRLTG